MRNNIQKIIITITMIVLVFCVVYVPWQAEYKGKVEFLGYHVSWNKPAIYTDSDFVTFNDMPNVKADNSSNADNPQKLLNQARSTYGMPELPESPLKKRNEVLQQGYTIYPSWVKDFAIIDYKRIILNCAGTILIGGASYIVSTIIIKIK